MEKDRRTFTVTVARNRARRTIVSFEALHQFITVSVDWEQEGEHRVLYFEL